MADEHTQPTVQSVTIEIERKYEVAAEQRFPEAHVLAAAGFGCGAAQEVELHAMYFDTPDAALAQRGMAFRRRAGGADEGWHLKERGARGTRETHWRLSDTVPEAAREHITAVLGGETPELIPCAELRTRRAVRVLSFDNADVIECADDQVRAHDLRRGVRRVWREWEAELLPHAAETLLDRLEPVLLAAGAYPSLSPAKVARASGQLIELAELRGAPAEIIVQLRELDSADQAAARRVEA